MGKLHQVMVSELKLFGYHGIYEEERLQGTFFQFDLNVSTDFSGAIDNDQLDDSLNYVKLIEIVKQENEKPSDMLESLGDRIAKTIFDAYPLAKGLRLKIQKLNPPIGEDLKSVGILIEESR